MPPSPQPIPPRQPGESAYAYRKRRSIAQTGETPYERRIRLGRGRGLSMQEARGKTTPRGLSEYQRRAQQSQAQYGLSPYQLWRQNTIADMTAEGYTPQTTNMSWNRLLKIWPKMKWMNHRSSPGGAELDPPGGRITEDMLLQATLFEQQGFLDRGWIETRIEDRYYAMFEFVERDDPMPGRQFFYYERQSYMPVSWWYYH